MQELLIETIRTDGGVQSRERITEEYVTELADFIKAGKKLPPIEVYGDGGEVWAADGFHRLVAHQRAGKRTIRCNVHRGTKADAAWASCAANQEHGLRRTNADKRHAVEMAVKMRPELSARAVADHVGVDEQMVRASKLRCGIPAPEQVTGKDGKAYPAHRIRPPWEVEAQGVAPRKIPPPPSGNATAPPPQTPSDVDETMVGQCVEIIKETGRASTSSFQRRLRIGYTTAARIMDVLEERGIVGPANGSEPREVLVDLGSVTPPSPVPAEQKAPARMDDVGKPIPDHLMPLFDRGQEVQALLSQLSSMKGLLKRAEESGDVLYAEVNFNSALAALQTAYADIKATKPFAVCPWCHGTFSDQCRGCGHRGALGEYRWNTIVQRELKGGA
jgi:hypothetical protein